MPTDSMTRSSYRLSSEARERLRHQIAEAHEPVAQFWPMKSFVHHNPLHGLEHLPFDAAVREAQHLLGGEGYLSNSEYREMYRNGRITEQGVRKALQRVGPPLHEEAVIEAGSRQISPSDVVRLHLLVGINPLNPALAAWTFGSAGATKRFQDDLAPESRQRIIERTLRDSGSAKNGAEEWYLTKLWSSASSALDLSSKDHHEGGQEERSAPQPPAGRPGEEVSLPAQRTVSDWVDSLAGVSIVEQINEQMIKWTAAFVDEGIAGWRMPGRGAGFYHCWRELAQRDFSARFLGIKSFAQKLRDLPSAPEEAIALSLDRLEVPEPRWTEYLSRHLAHLPGWAGLIRWLGENPEYPGQRQHPIDPVQYLAVRLFYEAEFVDAACRRHWGIPGKLSGLEFYWRDHFDEYPGVPATDPSPASRGMGRDALWRDGWRLFRLAQFLELTPGEVEQLHSSGIQRLLGWLDAFPEDRHGPVWLEAYEDRYREQVIDQLLAQQGKKKGQPNRRPRAQLVFCIDVRSEPFRRHVEAQGPYETFGFAGFFGVAVSHQAFDSEERVPLCPVLLTPKHAVTEVPRPGQEKLLESYASGTRWRRLGHHLFHDLKQNPIASLMLIDVLGFLFSVGLTGKTLLQGPYKRMKEPILRWLSRPIATEISVGGAPGGQDAAAHPGGSDRSLAGLALGFTLDEQATFVENGLRTMGLTNDFGRFVVLCGHGSESDNNPYFGALHCGACGGRHGDPNARVFAAMGNNPSVRRLLKERGLAIPDDTWFLGAKHLTTTDRVLFYDAEDIPTSHLEDWRVMQADLEKAGAHQALERCHRLPRAPKGLSPERAYRHVDSRSADWANVRPEWGLSGNAAFLIGRRSLTGGLNLEGRVFLHSYDPETDPEGQILEKIMTAPLIVGEWISMEHYFSGVDPWFYGSGSKVIHNVVGGVGLMLGSQSDLQTGLPLQTVNDGAIHFHEPMRLLTIIEAPVSRISPIIQKHTLLQHLFHNQWLNLIALNPATFEFQRYNPDSSWEPCR